MTRILLIGLISKHGQSNQKFNSRWAGRKSWNNIWRQFFFDGGGSDFGWYLHMWFCFLSTLEKPPCLVFNDEVNNVSLFSNLSELTNRTAVAVKKLFLKNKMCYKNSVFAIINWHYLPKKLKQSNLWICFRTKNGFVGIKIWIIKWKASE